MGYGNYVHTPVQMDEGTMVVLEGGHYDRTFVLESPVCLDFPRHLVVQKDASVRLTVMILPSVSKNLSLTVDITGERANVQIAVLTVSDEGDEVNLNFCVHHRASDSFSDQKIISIASGKSVITFDGRIIVAPSLSKVEAYQENRNLMLEANSRIEATPQLEIYSDDVKCSHGTAIGALNLDERFYMRSRGIPEDEAKVLQMLSFASPIADSLPEEDREAGLRIIECAVRMVTECL